MPIDCPLAMHPPASDIDLRCSLLQAVGASGAIFGMVGAWGAFCLMNESVLGRATSQRALQSVAQTVMLNVAYGMSSSQIDNMGHLGVSPRRYLFIHKSEICVVREQHKKTQGRIPPASSLPTPAW